MQLVYAPGFLLPALSYISHVQSVKIPNVTFRTAFQRPSMLLANITVLSAHIIHLHTALHVLRAHGMNKDARDTLQHVQSCSLCQTNILFPTWWGFTTGHDQLKLEAVVHHVVAVDFCTSDHTALAKLAAATNLVIVFEQVLRDKQHAFPPTAARQNAD